MNQRTGGILLPLFSLPNPYGCGAMGEEARRFLDFLYDSGIQCWQLLPLVPTGAGNSPYMSPSAFAGNPFLIDIVSLKNAGYLSSAALDAARYDGNPNRVDYDFLTRTRIPLLRQAWDAARHNEALTRELTAYQEKNHWWLQPHALFMALREHFGLPVDEWDEDIRARKASAVAYYAQLLCREIDFHIFLQYVFDTQWQSLREYAALRHVKLFGDIPIYVSPDSADVWRAPNLFQLNSELRPAKVAGVPPDAFSADGQLWGNPLYDWNGNREAVFDWWLRRIGRASELYDMVRIDHFRAFHTYWSVPSDAKTAIAGNWVQGPGQPLLDCVQSAFPQLEIIAEDLGDLDHDAIRFIQNTGLPGMKILLYAFDPEAESAFLPHNCPQNSVMYTGTHDTPTFLQWLVDLSNKKERQYAFDYLRLRDDEGWCWGAIACAWASPCRLAVAPLQDVLGLGAEARMNHPGTEGAHNWSWRVSAAALNPSVSSRLHRLCHVYRR